jgi:protein TonB
VAARSRNRAFQYALLASLALHIAFLIGIPDLRPAMTRAVESVPLVARLLDLQPAPLPEAPKREERPAPAREPGRTIQQLPVETPAPPTPSPVAAAEPAPPAAAQPVAAAQAAPPPAAPAPVPDNTEARSRDQYRIELIAAAKRIKDELRYPPLARENRWQGDVRVGVAINPGGAASIEVRESSGYEVLDRQAVEIFRRAADSVPVPAALRGKAFALEPVQTVFRFEN